MAKEALREVHQLEKDYPEITYLQFLEASCLTVLGQKEEAANVLKTALIEFPENDEAVQLYQALTGKENLE
jgi:predicted Zn-dependent protease